MPFSIILLSICILQFCTLFIVPSRFVVTSDLREQTCYCPSPRPTKLQFLIDSRLARYVFIFLIYILLFHFYCCLLLTNVLFYCYRWPITSSSRPTPGWPSWHEILRKFISAISTIILPQLIFHISRSYFILSYYKTELETERDPVARQWLIQQLTNVETEVLNIMRADRERLERENRNMEAALLRIRQQQNRRN